MRSRSVLIALTLASCKTPAPDAGTDAGAGPALSVSAAVTASAPPTPPPAKTEFRSGGTVKLTVEKSLPLEFLGQGSWAALSPKGEHVIVGGPGRATFFPGDKPFNGAEPANAAFTSDGKRFFLLRPGRTRNVNEVTVHASNDLHEITKLTNAFDPVWRGDDLLFYRDGQAFELTGTETKRLGPEKPAFKDRPFAVVIAPNLESMIVVDEAERRLMGARRVALKPSGRDLTLITAEVLAKLAKKPEPVAAVAPDASRVCVMGALPTETAIWCASDDTPAEQIATFTDPHKHFALAFVGPNLLGYRVGSSGVVGVADFRTRTASMVAIPGGTTPTDLTPLPGGKLAVARDLFRLGIVNLEEKKFTPLGDDSAAPKSVAGLATDDTSFAVAGGSVANGVGIFKVTVK